MRYDRAAVVLVVLCAAACGQSAAEALRVPASRPARASARLGLALLREIRREGRSAVVAPAAALDALLLLRAGTAGEARAEIDAALGGPAESWSDAHVEAAALRALLAGAAPTARTATRWWFERSALRGGVLSARTLGRLAAIHGGDLIAFERFEPFEDARSRMEAWYAAATDGRAPGALKDVRERVWGNESLLAAAVTAETDWSTPFHGGERFDFRREDGRVERPFGFSGSLRARRRATSSADDLRLPLRGGLSFVVLTPPPGVPLTRFEDGLAPDRLSPADEGADAWWNWTPRRLQVRLPEFSLRTDADLAAVVRPLGVRTVFRASKAWRISAESHRLAAARVVADVRVQGVGRSSAQAASFATNEAPEPEEAYVADRPFLFAVTHDATGAVVLFGRYAEPPPAPR